MADGSADVAALRAAYLGARRELAAAIGPAALAELDASEPPTPPGQQEGAVETLRAPPESQLVRTDCSATEFSYPRDTREEERCPRGRAAAEARAANGKEPSWARGATGEHSWDDHWRRSPGPSRPSCPREPPRHAAERPWRAGDG